MDSQDSISKKVILLGHFGVGKTSLVKRFVHSMFSEAYQTTIGVKVDKKTIEVKGRNLTFIIWDIEGGASQSQLPQSYFMGSQGIIYVCDLSRSATWSTMAAEIDRFREMLPKASVQVVGNKSDLLSPAELAQVLPQIQPQLKWVTSAKTGESVEQIFLDLGMAMLP